MARTVEIEFSAREYRALVDMLEIADWVISSRDTDEDAEKRPYCQLLQKALAFAGQMGLGHLIEYDADEDMYVETRHYEENGLYREFLDEYDNDTFWEELIARLAWRDFVQQHGEDHALKMSMQDRFRETSIREADYSQEFESHGLKNLRLQNIAGNGKAS